MSSPDPRQAQLGAFAALAAFGFWGLAPIYYKWFYGVPPLEITAHRVIWALPLLVIFLLWRDGRQRMLQRLRLPWRTLRWLLLSAWLVAFNWLIFVYAVSTDQVLSTSLGYFINPLVNVLLGMVFLGERLGRLRLPAVLLAAFGTTYLGVYIGQPPWLALSLAFSFGFYGLIRKRLGVGPIIGLLWEVLWLLPAALVYLLWAGSHEHLYFFGVPGSVDALLMTAGLATVLPLLAFNAAAQRLSLTVLGFFQYLAPSCTFLLAVLVYGEPFTHGHQVAFVCIWTALFLVSVGPLLRRRWQAA
ncbi:MAG: EamA family transporter RarD [Wenzhouxiangellaceae bacterium]